MKVLELQDIHVHPKWIEESKRHINKVCEVVIAEKVDAITIAGDFFHASIMANDKSAWADVLTMARQLQAAAPVYYVTGTPSHDAPGCYESFKDIGWKEINIGISEKLGDLLIMGIPEITPAFIMAQAPELSKVEAIATQYELVEDVIDSYYAPLALQHDGPVHFMGHGHVSGVKFREDQKPRSSDFMYSEQLLARIGADRYQFGHIHLPQQFETINGAYGGSSHITWNDLGFKPGFTVVRFSDKGKKYFLSRFNYGDPERQKITIKDISDLTGFVKGIRFEANLWIDVECDKSFAEQFDAAGTLEKIKESASLGPLSKVTTNIQRVENVRVETEEYEKCKTLEDLYKIFDPEVNSSTLLKVREAEEATKADIGASERRDFEFLDLYLKGSKAGRENGVDEIKLDFNDFQTGANLLVGDNGTGKSFNLGFCTPFSEHLPTGANFKDLFELKDSQIIRRWADGANIITQKIMIDPTLANPSAKYYMDINGEALNADGNKKSFDDIVADHFGSIKMFMTCAFRGQKENSNFPSLENARETDLRKIFTELSGIDRTPLKLYAHDKAATMARSIELDVKEAETLESTKESFETLAEDVKIKGAEKSEKNQNMIEKSEKLEELKKDKEVFDKDISDNDAIEKQITELKEAGLSGLNEIDALVAENAGIIKTLEDSDNLKYELSLLKEKQTAYNAAAKNYFETQGIFNNALSAWNKDKNAAAGDREIIAGKAEDIKGRIAREKLTISENTHKVKMFESSSTHLNKPCEHCKKLSSTASEEIRVNNNQIGSLKLESEEAEEALGDLTQLIEGYREDWEAIKIPVEPVAPEKLNLLKREMEELKIDAERLKALEGIIAGLKSSEEKSAEIKITIKNKIAILGEAQEKAEDLQKSIKPIDSAAFEALRLAASDSEAIINSLSREIGRLSAEIEGLVDRIKKSEAMDAKIEAINQRTEKQQVNVSEWKRIEEAFSPKGIPALELSMLAPQIDRVANSLLSSYGSRFSVETITQDLDSKGKNLIEKFKILVHDSMASDVKNLPNMSGGQAVWITKALQEAISKVAIERTGRNWLYSIMDEADAALDSSAIVDFYDMMNRAMDGARKLVAVSHSIEAKASINNIVEITKSFIGYGE